jgi:threonine synthase
MKTGVLERYRAHLPVTDATPMITLGEGETPLVRSHAVGRLVGCGDVYFKLEGCNPTGSFKDRGMVVAVAKALEAKATGIICASTGNTSASAAAYGALAGLPAMVVVPKGTVARGKLAQAIAHGSRIVLVDGSFDDALSIVRAITERNPIVPVNSLNPARLQGQKTAAFEVIESLGAAPDHVLIPVGNGGNITAYWLGFTEATDMGWATTRPKMMGFQALGAAPIVKGEPVKNPQTIASAIRIGNPAHWDGAIRARDESGGTVGTVSDDDIMEAYKLLAREEGIFCEPASAAPVAGLLKLSREGLHLKGKRVVCIITGTGLKDPDLAGELEPVVMEEYPAELDAIERALAPAVKSDRKAPAFSERASKGPH